LKTAPPILRLSDLHVRHGAAVAVQGLTTTVHPGEVVGLIGPDGAGKTSTLRVAAGLQRADSGTVEAFGADVWTHRRLLHHRLGYLAQRFALYGDLTVDENIRFFALLLGVAKWRARRDMLLERVELTPFRYRPADRLSGGMKQKLALACALMHSPEFLILDEPTTGVDPVTRREFWRLLGELVAEGMTLLVATPYLDEAERCSRVILMHQGSALADAPPRALAAQVPGTMVEVAATPRSLASRVLESHPTVRGLAAFSDRFHARLDAGPAAVETIRDALLQAGVFVSDIRPIPAGLEDAYLFLTGAPPRPLEAP